MSSAEPALPGIYFITAKTSQKCAIMPACPGRDQDKPVPCHSIADNTGSQQTLATILYWLDECSRAHGDDCNPNVDETWTPTRLLQIMENGSVRLRTSFPDGAVRYITLSHRWGSGSDEQPKLTLHNIEAYRNGIDVHKLPQAFQDTINVARRLRVNFVWIDSLCILQGDRLDWQREVARMWSVYSNGYLNISAGLSNSDQGCFAQRDPSRVESFAVDDGQGHGSQPEIMYKPQFWYHEVECSPVNLRGWV